MGIAMARPSGMLWMAIAMASGRPAATCAHASCEQLLGEAKEANPKAGRAFFWLHVVSVAGTLRRPVGGVRYRMERSNIRSHPLWKVM